MADRARAIHQTMVAEGFERKRDGTRRLVFEGMLDVRGRPVSVSVAFADDSLTSLPKLALLDRANQLPTILAHVENGDGICFAHNEEMQLDPLTPSRTVALCLVKMREELHRMTGADLAAEVRAELPQHWLGGSVLVDLPKTFAGPGKLYAIPRGDTGGVNWLLTKGPAGLRRFGLPPDEFRHAITGARSPAVIAVSNPLGIYPTTRQPDTLLGLRGWAKSNSDRLFDEIAAALADLPVADLTFFLNAPNGVIGGTVTLPALIARAVQRKGFLVSHLQNPTDATRVKRLSGHRADADFIFSRNLVEQPALSGLRIALVGAGTIGGALAKLLAQSGAGHAGGELTIFDPQELTAGNVGRHLLGVPHIGMKKAEGTRQVLSALYPDNAIVAVNSDVLTAVRHGLETFDLVVNATGEQGLSDVLSERLEDLRRVGKPVPAALHGWLEGNGVAARAILVDDGTGACFRCLRLADGHSQRYPAMRTDHPASLTPADCGEGVYFAYGPGAPAIAAGLMVQMLLDWRAGHPDPKLRTIRIVHEATHQCRDQSPSKLQACPVCGSRM